MMVSLVSAERANEPAEAVVNLFDATQAATPV